MSLPKGDKRMTLQRLRSLILLGTLVAAGCTDPDDVPEAHVSAVIEAAPGAAPGSPQRTPNRTALFGDLHVHTSWSVDAYAGANRLGPNSAYRFARGEAVTLPTGELAQLKRPLDFVALTDHAEGFATHLACTIPGSPEFDDPQCRGMRAGDMDQDTLLRVAFERGLPRPALRDPDLCDDSARCAANARDTWQRVQAVANAFNDPGRFTTLIGYEFSSLLPDFGMLHRNVIFRGSDVIPHAISSQDVVDQADFFAQLDAACTPPCSVLTIPHNTNYSWGLTFSRTDEDGSAFTPEELARRARLERLFEVTQQKGNSECQLGVGASDEDCNVGNLFPPCAEGQTTRCVRPASFLRNVLLDGLALADENGLNPYRLGVIGATDTHQSDPGNTRSAVPGQFGAALDSRIGTRHVMRLEHVVVGPVRRMSAGGLAGVWAEANTRADLFDALQRREAFGTSGSRLRIRFFAGNYPADLGERPEPLTTAYAKGVPMGAVYRGATPPRFWVWASQDPDGAALDRIQIIKGWTEDGEPRQRVRDLVCADNRQPDASGRCPPTSASVDLDSCAATGAPGATELQATFTDSEALPGERAFYYVRVLENPTCRWTTVLARRGGADLPEDVPATVAQRGWSSPIWIDPPAP